jgi:monoamine oxidase
MTSETDVVIVGAGSAGLSAAKELAKRGLSYVVVDGSHRIGGRAYSEEIAPGVWFDLGCSFLHHGATNPFGPIADNLGVPLNRERADMFSHIRACRNGIQLTDEESARFGQYDADCEEAIKASVARGEDRAISELVDTENEFFPPYANAMAVINNMDIDETSAVDHHDFGDGDVASNLDIPVPGGYGNLVKTWGADVDVTLNCRVDKIDWSGSGVAVETVKGTVRGRVALVTVSTGILASNNILFDPVLPDWKIEAYLGLPTGTVNKICLHFDKDVFGPDGLGFYTTWSDAGDAAFLEASINGNDTAIVYVGGRHGIWLEKQGQQAGHDFALDRVADVFGNDVRKEVTRSIVTAWGADPWTLGSYSRARPGHTHQRKGLAKLIDGRLFFAGEATSSGAGSSCHGAYLSGIRAAEEIAEILGS